MAINSFAGLRDMRASLLGARVLAVKIAGGSDMCFSGCSSINEVRWNYGTCAILWLKDIDSSLWGGTGTSCAWSYVPLKFGIIWKYYSSSRSLTTEGSTYMQGSIKPVCIPHIPH